MYVQSVVRTLFVLFLSVWSVCLAEKHATFRVLTESFPPYNYVEDGEPTGLATEVVQAMLKQAGLTAKLEFLPWARAYRTAMTEPNTLIFSIARIPERESLFEWLGVVGPYWTSLYKRRADESIEIKNLADARRYRIGVSQDDVIHTYLESEGFPHLEVARNDQVAVRMMYAGRFDLLAVDEAALPFRVKVEGYAINELQRVVRIDALSEQLYVAINPKSDPALINTLKDALEEIHLNGTYDEILTRYFADPS